MKIAFLVLCHKNANQINKLIDVLNDKNVDFYIHKDAKSQNLNLRDGENINILDRRECVNIKWGSFSMIQATLNLIHSCLSSNVRYDYILLISGQDFPLKSTTRLMSFLSSNSGSNFISYIPHDRKEFSMFQMRNKIYYPNCFFYNLRLLYYPKRIYSFIADYLVCRNKNIMRKNLTGLNFEYGSQWWCLQQDCLSWMMNYINVHPEYCDFFKHSMIPDECFFQTLFSCSPFLHTKKDSIIFTDFPEGASHPRLIEEKDIEELVKSPNFFFARKFDISVNPKPIEMLIKHINANNSN